MRGANKLILREILAIFWKRRIYRRNGLNSQGHTKLAHNQKSTLLTMSNGKHLSKWPQECLQIGKNDCYMHKLGINNMDKNNFVL